MISKTRKYNWVCCTCGSILYGEAIKMTKDFTGHIYCPFCNTEEKRTTSYDCMTEKQGKEYLKLVAKKANECPYNNLNFATYEILTKYNLKYKELGIPQRMWL